MSRTSTISNATLSENSFYVGINLQDILYGVQLVLYFKTMHIYLARRKERRKSDVFYAAFSSVMLLLVTLWVASEAIFGQKMWLLDRNYPGGPLAYGWAHTSDVYMDFGTTAVIILQQMTDALMMYRCRIVWDSLRAIIIPFIMWLTNLALGILVAWAAATPGGNFFSGIAAKLGLAYYTLSVFLNATLTCMICYRLVCHARTVKEYLGEEHASPYFTIVGLLVESVLPYTLSGIAFLISYGVRSEMEIAFSCVYTLMTSVSPQLLILRVAEGKAWQKDTMEGPPASLVVFPPWSDAEHGDGRGAVVHLEALPGVYHPESGEGNNNLPHKSCI